MNLMFMKLMILQQSLFKVYLLA